MDHIQELKSRLFWIAVYFVGFSGLAYSYFPELSKALILPLGNEKLYYMTPAGGLSFILKVCMYVGLIACMPVIIYHLYRFIAPVLKKTTLRAVLGFTFASVMLAGLGIAFAYFVSLPAALHFLTTVTVEQITAMITIDSYLSFVIAYLFAGALLFQLPLILLMIDTVTPLPPRRLMGLQRHMIIASFVIAAIVSPTPDVINQTLLAAPMVVMYQVGIILIAWRQALRRRSKKPAQKITSHSEAHWELPVFEAPSEPEISASVHAPQKSVRMKSIDGFHRPTPHPRSLVPLVVPERPAVVRPTERPVRRSIDGFFS
jgi:sec-independent protein translocase protein TatC